MSKPTALSIGIQRGGLEIRQFMRQRESVVFTLAFPIILLAIFGSVFLILGYGIMFWLGFFILIGILDLVLFSVVKRPPHVNYKLALEWIIISLPFIYWLIKYNQWIFLVAIIAFLIGQYLRRSYIYKILYPFSKELHR